jgi:bifunctional non-homologous end joining protein LigD
MTLRYPVSPMKATIGNLPPDDENWAYEIKWDGYRTLCFVSKDGVRLQSSNLLDVTAKYPELHEIAGSVNAGSAIIEASSRARRRRSTAIRTDAAARHTGRVLRVRRLVDQRSRHHRAAI